MTTSSEQRVLLWQPSEELRHHSNLMRYMQWLNQEKGFSFQNRNELWGKFL